MANGTNLRIVEPNPNGPSLLPVIGKLRYAADRTRPDILASLGEVSTGGMKEASAEHVKCAKQMWNFTKKTSDRGLTFGGKQPCKLFAFVDAAHIMDGNGKSRQGCAIFTSTDSGAIFCHSKNDTLVSHSSTESELRAADIGIRALIHIQDILEFLGKYNGEPTVVYIDNKSAIELCKTLKSTQKTKHILVCINFIRECINRKRIELRFIPTDMNVADTLTKPLAREKFNRFNNYIMNGFDGVEIENLAIQMPSVERTILYAEIEEFVTKFDLVVNALSITFHEKRIKATMI
jgi:hypothetical protein